MHVFMTTENAVQYPRNLAPVEPSAGPLGPVPHPPWSQELHLGWVVRRRWPQDSRHRFAGARDGEVTGHYFHLAQMDLSPSQGSSTKHIPGMGTHWWEVGCPGRAWMGTDKALLTAPQ